MDTELRSMHQDWWVKFDIEVNGGAEVPMRLGGRFTADFGDGDVRFINAGGYTEVRKTYSSKGRRTITLRGDVRHIALDVTGSPAKYFDMDICGCCNIDRISGVFPEMRSIDVSGMKKLDRLYLKSTKMQSLDLSGLESLAAVDVSRSTQLTSLILPASMPNIDLINISNTSIGGHISFSGYPSLRLIHASRTRISSVDVSGCANLHTIELAGTNISSIDISNNSNLESLSVNDCSGLTSLSLENNKKLRVLYTGSSGITSLDLSGMNRLEILHIANLNMSGIDLSDCTNLKSLAAESSGLVGISLPNSRYAIHAQMSNCSNLASFNFHKNAIKNALLSRTSLSGVYYDFTGCAGLNSIYIPTPSSSGYVSLDNIVNRKTKYKTGSHLYGIPAICVEGRVRFRGSLNSHGDPDIDDYFGQIQFMADIVKSESLYEYNQSFYVPNSLTDEMARDSYDSIKTLFLDCPLVCHNSSARELGTPSICFNCKHKIENIPGTRSQKMSIVCKKNAKFFCIPEQRSGYAYDMGYKFEYNNGVITKKNPSMAISTTPVGANDVKITFTMTQWEKRNSWDACVFESSYSGDYSSRIISFQKA